MIRVLPNNDGNSHVVYFCREKISLAKFLGVAEFPSI